MTTQTTPQTTSSHLVPTSSPNPGTTSEIDLVPRPHPLGDEVELESERRPPKNHHLVPPTGTTSNTHTNTHHTTSPTDVMEDAR